VGCAHGLVGGNGTLMESVKAIKTKGVVHVIGVPGHGAVPISAYELAVVLLLKEGKVIH